MFLRFFLSLLIIFAPLPLHAQQLTAAPSSVYVPVLFKGMKVDPGRPLALDFLVDTGTEAPDEAGIQQASDRMVAYFLSALTTPDKDLWVNLSPVEQDRIVPSGLGQTALGHDLLEQDYQLKRLTASLLHPEGDVGRMFWQRVYQDLYERYGQTDIEVDSFNKVWIMPDKALVYQSGDTAYVGEARLKVLLDRDYLALGAVAPQPGADQDISAQMMREVVIPEIEREVNDGKQFTDLRQMFHALILAKWYKQALKRGLLGRIYADRQKTDGIDIPDAEGQIAAVYGEYVRAYEKGSYGMIKEDVDPSTGELVAHKYFTGGNVFTGPVDVRDAAEDHPLSIVGKPFVREYELKRVDKAELTPKEAAAIVRKPEIWRSLSVQDRYAARKALMGILQTGTIEEIENLPVFVGVSDEHGTIEKLDQLLLHAFRSVSVGRKKLWQIDQFSSEMPISKQLPQDLRLEDFKGKLFFHNLGDFIDRGPRGLAVFKRSKELIDAGLSDFVIGNHDFWMFLNLQGFHLPWYDGFNFYGYADIYDEREGSVDDLVKKYRQDDPDVSRMQWWEKKLALFTTYQMARQKDTWQGVQKKAQQFFETETWGFSEDDIKRWSVTPEGILWNKLRGYDPRVGDVYIGTRAVGLVSVKWWEDLVLEFKKHLSEYGAGMSGSARGRLEQAIRMMEQDIISVLHQDLEKGLSNGQWWLRVFEAINYGNYETPEWWAKDWVFHKDWGTSILKEINPGFNENVVQDGPVNGSTVQDQDVSFGNYLGHPELKGMSQFFRKNFSLFQTDVYGNTYMHAFLPMDMETGEFRFVYKEQEYRGKGSPGKPSVWAGLTRIQDDVKNLSYNLQEIHEALQLVNSWYADRTSDIKAVNVAEAINTFGAEKLAEVNGFERLATGHIPFHEFHINLTPEQKGVIDGFLVQDRLIFTDHGMGQRYKYRGAYARFSTKNGIQHIGSEHETSLDLVSPARTTIIKDGKKQFLFANNGMEARDFRARVIEGIQQQIERSIETAVDDREKKTGNDNAEALGGIDLAGDDFIRMSGEGIVITEELSQKLLDLQQGLKGFRPVPVGGLVPAHVRSVGFDF
jgi:hypothetical protein